jgi:hypothetical protein
MNKCDICNQEIRGESVDLMITTTTYDETGEPAKTMESAPQGIEEDYVVACKQCEQDAVAAWNEMLYRWRSGK